MTEPITKQELIDASQDALTLEQVVNGSDATDVTSRLARTYPSLAKAMRLIVQNGLLAATAFNLKSAMEASALVDNDYAVVTDDPTPLNNGFYQKQSGVFEFLAWNPINQFLAALAAETSARVAGDATNATAIATEQAARIAADNAEASTRASADSANAAAIAAESSTRAGQITTLNADFAAAIGDEEDARIAADDALADLVDAEEAARINADNAEAAARASGDSTNATAIAAESSTRAAQIATLNSGFATAISDEEDARIAADAVNAAAVSAEATTRATAITTEASARIAGDAANSTAIAAETAARQSAITAEATARTAAINSESTARQAADAAINAELDAETASRISADSSLQSQITAEASTRAAADATNAAAIATEATIRANADTTLQTNLTTEATTRASADSAEQAARIAADNALQAALTAEQSARTSGDAENSTAINTEQSARIAADNTLQANINSEAATRASADSANVAAIAAEANARAAAIAALSADDLELQAGIDANAAAIAAEEAARIAAVAAEQTTRTEQVGLINVLLSKIFGAVRFDGVHDDDGNKYLFAIFGAGSKLGFGITSKLKMIWGGNQLVLDRMIGIKDSAGRYAVAITQNGKVRIPNLVLPAWVTSALTSLSAADSAEQAARIAADATLTTAQNSTASSLATLAANFAIAAGVHDDAGNKYALALVNRSTGRIAWGITRKAESVVSGAKHRGDRLPFVLLDRFNRAAISVTASGKVRIPNLVLPQSLVDQVIAALPPFDAATKIKPLAAAVWAEINHVVGYGQSLSRGATTTTPISITQPYSNVMLKSGVKIKPYEDGYDASELVPLVETVTTVDGSNAESPTSGALNGFSRRVVASGAAAADYVMLGTQSGRGGHTVQMLSEDDRFANIVAHINDAKALAVAAGKSYAVTAVTWIQGEDDVAISTPEAVYLYKMYALFDRIRQYAFDIGNQFAPWILMYQTGGHRSYASGHFDIATAQLRAMQERDEVVMATPVYRCPHTENNVHLTAEGSWLLGEYFGRALFWTLFLGKKWLPLHPVDVSWTATHIDIQYHVPVKPIQISTLICTAAENSGFDIWTADGTLISDAISGVSVLSDDTIRVSLNPAATIPSDAAICYGRGRDVLPRASGPVNGARGNVMDSHGLYDTAVSPLGNTFALYNVSAMFKHDRIKGF